jgi:hypothetical protein
MNREDVLKILENHRAELKYQYGIQSLSVFGSVARGDSGPLSDVDLLVEMSPPYTFDRYIQAKFYLEDLLNTSVDLVMEDTLKPHARATVEQELIRVT